ncbi:hypothetical protein [Altererythrobacter sp. ZODW24]|uniref:hypothetical protein n=1 Tax=Altererythrobacter sp. ZODW24 TaxID=2185142 RepID=UPI0013B44408|nr:hypothetical protein [Altererythrobacter sp. ZODW24]
MALWFAALFGIGSFVLPAQLFGAISGQETLGVTAKIVIALVAAIIGALLGVLIARKIAASQATAPVRKRAPNLRPEDAHPDAPARRPISALEELGEEKLAESVPEENAEEEEEAATPRRRRSLSVTEESGRSEYLDFVPLPGQERDKERAAFPGNDSADVLDFSDHPDMLPAEEPEDSVAEIAEPQAFSAPVELEEPLDLIAQEEEEIDALEQPADESAQEIDGNPAPAEEAIKLPVGDRPVEELGMVELVERLALSIKQRGEAPIAARAAISESFFAAPAVEADTLKVTENLESAGQEPTEFGVMPSALQSLMIDEQDDDEDDDEPFPALDLTKSLRPFSAPIEDIAAENTAKDVGEYLEETTEDYSDDQFTVLPKPVELGTEAEAIEEEWVTETEDAEGDFACDAAEDTAKNDDEDSEEGSYTSLLAMKSPFLPGQEPVRIEEEDEDEGEIQPMVVFPNADILHGQASSFGSDASEDEASPELSTFGAPDTIRPFDAPGAAFSAASPAPQKADPVETEKALRDALSTLRRMSGAA